MRERGFIVLLSFLLPRSPIFVFTSEHLSQPAEKDSEFRGDAAPRAAEPVAMEAGF